MEVLGEECPTIQLTPRYSQDIKIYAKVEGNKGKMDKQQSMPDDGFETTV